MKGKKSEKSNAPTKAYRDHEQRIQDLAISPDGRMLATGSFDGVTRIFCTDSEEVVAKLGLTAPVTKLAWSGDSRRLATGEADGLIHIWDIETKKQMGHLKGHTSSITALSWSANSELLGSGALDERIRVWHVEKKNFVYQPPRHFANATALAWSPDGLTMAYALSNGRVFFWSRATRQAESVALSTEFIESISWTRSGDYLACSTKEGTIRLVNTQFKYEEFVLEGHTAAVATICFSHDGRLMASRSTDAELRLWRTEDWECVAEYPVPEVQPSSQSGLVAFEPRGNRILTTGRQDRSVYAAQYDADSLQTQSATLATRKHTSAKVVLVGESNVGKSCLAMRLAEGRVPESGSMPTTHGMQLWQLAPEKLHRSAVPADDESREIIFWDMGGQDEYRLVHQLFLHDTTIALVLFDPTRGRLAFDDVRSWNKRLQKQLKHRKAVKILVGSKQDSPSTLVRRGDIENLATECGFAKYVETSAFTGAGIEQLKECIAASLDWTTLSRTNRPRLFQMIRDEIKILRSQGEVVVLLSDFMQRLETIVSRAEGHEELSTPAIHAVATQLAAQGMIANVRLASGEKALVLQIGEIERYAGALIVAARNNPRGVPALDERQVAAQALAFPGIPDEERLSRANELVILECVSQLLLEHGICFRHEGLLIFPTLFSITRGRTPTASAQPAALQYEFSGAVDNIYASMVAWLVLSEEFGSVRLWDDGVEFETSDHILCGVRKLDRGGGVSQLELFFGDPIRDEVRDRFVSFIEDHLRRNGVDVLEHMHLSCPCGYEFPEKTLRARLGGGHSDIGCPECDARSSVSEGVDEIRQRHSDVWDHTVALRTQIQESVKRQVEDMSSAFRGRRTWSKGTLNILHLSDLHFSHDDKDELHFAALEKDLRASRSRGGLGIRELDYLVVSGDIANTGSPDEYQVAYRFLSKIISMFGLSGERCIIVPGNHDVSWDQDVYEYLPTRRVSDGMLREGNFVKESHGYLIRNESLYAKRFENFSRQLFHMILQSPYPEDSAKQTVVFTFPPRLQFLALNSAYAIDEYHPCRSAIDLESLACGLSEADKQLDHAGIDADEVLRIAVVHHPVRGREQIADDVYLEQLMKSGVKLMLHGHAHEESAEVVGYHLRDRVHVIGGGCLGQESGTRPESMPRLYNLIRIVDFRNVEVHTRCLIRFGGAWSGWAVWPGNYPDEKRTFYSFKL